MMKNRRYGIRMLAIFLIGLLCLAGCASAPEEKDAADASLMDTSASQGRSNDPYAGMTFDEILKAMGLTPGQESISVDACYKWYGQSFLELEEEATQIVIARGTKFYKKSDITQTAELQVLKTLKGTPHDTIVLYQFEGEVDIQVGETYILFMKSQENGIANGYYALGGNQGVIQIGSETKMVTVYDQKIMDDDLAAWIAKNIAANRDLSALYSENKAYTIQFSRDLDTVK